MKQKHQWTKHEISKVKDLWETTNKQDLAKDLKVSEGQLNYLTGQIRKAGFSLPRKTVAGHLQGLIKDVFANQHNARPIRVR